VAGAPVADWADYDTFYTERYLGLPSENEAGYKASNVLTYAKDLRVPLLIIHGTADDNVYTVNSLKMTDALFKAGRRFEFLPLANQTHMVTKPEVVRLMHSRIATFFVEQLAKPSK
jgi:dipeptidyl-peptidase-4